MKILMSGGSGLLGKELLKLNSSIYAPSHNDMSVTSISDLEHSISIFKPDVFLHCAAYTSPPKCEKDPYMARSVNIEGTLNVVKVCEKHNIRMVYISTDYVFGGKDRVAHAVFDPTDPRGVYAKTKMAGEHIVQTYENSLIIRTSFCPRPFPYESALINQFVTKDYVDVIAPLIYKWVNSTYCGIVHVGTDIKSLYELAVKTKPNVKPIQLSDIDFYIPSFTALKITPFPEDIK